MVFTRLYVFMSRNGFAMVVVRFVLDESSREGLRFSVSLRAFGLRTGGGGWVFGFKERYSILLKHKP